MASNGAQFNESLTFAPEISNKKYNYRTGTGMMNSAEWSVHFDDFRNVVTTNVPAGWSDAVIDTGATVTQYTTADSTNPGTGVISFASTTASEGAAIYLPKSVMLKTGKKFWIETRVYLSDVTDHTFRFGLSDLTATTNPEDLWTTTAANLAVMGILDGSASISVLVDENNGGTSADTSTTHSITAATWTTLAMYWNGGALHFYKDGEIVADVSESTTANLPIDDVLLAPFIGCLNGNGAGGNVTLVDYIRIVQQR